MRIQALWTLRGLDGLTPDLIRESMKDAHPEVRRHALRLGEGPWKGDRRLVADAAGLANDPDPGVRLALALSLGDTDDPAAVPALLAIARRDGDDPTVRAAILSSAKPHAAGLLAGLFAEAGREPPPAEFVGPLFATLETAKGARGLAPLIAAIGSAERGTFAAWQFTAYAALRDASGGRLDELARADHALKGPVARLEKLAQAARECSKDADADESRRVAAVRALGRDGDGDLPILAALLGPRHPAPLRAEALRALGRLKTARVAGAVLGDWAAFSPETRGAVLDLLLSREATLAPLLDAIESKAVLAAEVNGPRRARLLAAKSPEVKARASKLFDAPDSARKDVVDRQRPALDLPGDPKAGAAAFAKACASCHKLGEVGVEVGPDLAALADKAPEALLIAILDPNRAFESRYASYSVETRDGRVLSGMVAAETANAVTLRGQEGKGETILRDDIEAMAASGRSLMPEGLENDLGTRGLADLIAFLSETGPPARSSRAIAPKSSGPPPTARSPCPRPPPRSPAKP